MRGACVASGAFALALRVPLTEFEDEMRKQGVGLTNGRTLTTSRWQRRLTGTIRNDQTQGHVWALTSGMTNSLLPDSRKNRRDPRRNDAIREVDADWPHDLGNGQ